MIDDISDIVESYNSDPEKEHARLEGHQLEYDLTWRYFERYLPAQGSILEIGAATGRYTLALAGRGYKVTAVDLSEALLEECRKNLSAEGHENQVQLIVADARDLSKVTRKDFDAVLLMGPLYHLIEEEDRRIALNEAFEHLKNGGILFSSFISRYGIMCDLIKDHPDWIEEKAEVRSILEKGKDPENQHRGGFRGYFAEISEVAPLHEAIGFETLALAGIEPVISADDESYNTLQGTLRQLWLDLLFEISMESSIIGASRHLLYIGRKKGIN